MEVVIVSGVRDVRLEFAEVPVKCPGYDALVLHRVRDRVGLENPRGGFQNAVPDGFLLFLDGPDGVGSGHHHLVVLLPVVLFLFLF